MAQASRKVRKIRRIKRERTLALGMATVALKQRDQARMIAYALEQELKKYLPAEQAAGVREDVTPKYTITTIPDESDPTPTTVSVGGLILE